MQALVTKTGEHIIVDPDTMNWAVHEDWHLCNGYAACSLMGRSVYLHRILMDHPIGHVHHKNGNPFDCRKSNLQILSPGDHKRLHGGAFGPRGPQEPRTAPNRTVHPPKSACGFKGVTWNRANGHWIAKATMNGKVHFLGNYPTAEEAAVIYDAFVIAYRPKGSYTNLIQTGN